MDGSSEAIVDLQAIRSNVAAMAERVGAAQVMAVVKSDGYGHGALATAAAALAGGATWLAVGHVDEALALRRAGFTTPILCLLAAHDAPHRQAVAAGIDLSASTADLVRQIAAAAELAGRPARLHLKVDTGMSRGGAPMERWAEVVATAMAEQAAGRCEITGIWSHLACADIPGHQSVDSQLSAFRHAIAEAERAGARPLVRHLANTAALLTRPDTWFDLVRPGGGVTGLCTLPGGPPGWLRPAMTVRTHLILAKRVPAGTGVSYGHRYVTAAHANLGLIALGYHEGIPRSAANTAQVFIRNRRLTISGTVCMNQCVVDAGDLPLEAGDEVLLFGPGDRGEPTAQDWADLIGTISYDVVTRFTAKIPRSYCGVTEAEAQVIRAGAAVLSGDQAGSDEAPGSEGAAAKATSGVPADGAGLAGVVVARQEA